MCTYVTEFADIAGSSGKGTEDWIPLTRASVYFDHPVSAPDTHTLNIDFLNPDRGPGARVAVELSQPAARRLVAAIQAALEAAPPE